MLQHRCLECGVERLDVGGMVFLTEGPPEAETELGCIVVDVNLAHDCRITHLNREPVPAVRIRKNSSLAMSLPLHLEQRDQDPEYVETDETRPSSMQTSAEKFVARLRCDPWKCAGKSRA